VNHHQKELSLRLVSRSFFIIVLVFLANVDFGIPSFKAISSEDISLGVSKYPAWCAWVNKLKTLSIYKTFVILFH